MRTRAPSCLLRTKVSFAGRKNILRSRLLTALYVAAGASLSAGAADLGIFETQTDIGAVAKPGGASFEPTNGSYLVSGGGENMWFTNDAFHFVWKKLSGNFSFEASIEWPMTGGNAHRKACLLVRQSLAPDSAYVDAAVHGDGLTSLQFREAAGETTHEIQAHVTRPARVGLERHGNAFFLTLPGENGGPAALSGAFMRVNLKDPVYVGLGVCAHDNKLLESARFTNVQLRPEPSLVDAKPVVHCALEIVPLGSKDRRAIYHSTDLIEAPNWSHDGKYFLFNSRGRIYRLPVEGGQPEAVDTGSAVRCNNDHGLSPAGTLLAISDQSREGGSRIYTLPSGGGAPKLLTPSAPSYWHGWSPDGTTIAYCGERNGEFDIYTIPADGGDERRLTTAKGLDDGPDYSPDGRFIYFNSERSGTMQIWRMKPDGSDQEPVTSDEFNNWFPHPSPDGKWLVFLAYEKDVTGHPANKPVRLRLMPIGGGQVQELARLFGGQGTINVPSWSPDSKQVAFVSYELLPR